MHTPRDRKIEEDIGAFLIEDQAKGGMHPYDSFKLCYFLKPLSKYSELSSHVFSKLTLGMKPIEFIFKNENS